MKIPHFLDMANASAHSSNTQTIATGTTGILAAIFTWTISTLLDVFRWYGMNLDSINKWLIHVAQLGGLIVMVYTILILRRNWKTGKKTPNVLSDK